MILDLEAARERRRTFFDVEWQSRRTPLVTVRQIIEMAGAEVDALLAEVERLRDAVTRLGKEKRINECPKCRWRFLKPEALTAHEPTCDGTLPPLFH